MTSKQLFKFVSLQIMKSWFHFVHNERNRYYARAQSGYLWIPVSKVPHDLVSPHSLIIKVKLWFSGTPASQCFHYTARSLSKAQRHYSRGCEPADATQTRAGTCWRWGGRWGDCCNIKPSSVTDWKHVRECPVMLNRSLCLLSEGRLRFMLRVINSLSCWERCVGLWHAWTDILTQISLFFLHLIYTHFSFIPRHSACTPVHSCLEGVRLVKRTHVCACVCTYRLVVVMWYTDLNI